MSEVQQGWQCPVCKSVMAPWVTSCVKCVSTQPQPYLWPYMHPYPWWGVYPYYSPWTLTLEPTAATFTPTTSAGTTTNIKHDMEEGPCSCGAWHFKGDFL